MLAAMKWVIAIAVAGVAGGCKDPPTPVDAAVVATPPIPAKTSSPAPTPTREAVEPPPPASDAGIASCTFLVRATKVAQPGPFTIATSTGSFEVVAQGSGEPFVVATLNVAPAAVTVPPSSGDGKRQLPGCVAAGASVFCVTSSGDVHRSRLTPAKPEGDTVVAHARSGSTLAAAVASAHTIVGYTRDRTTSEGPITEAYVEGDDGTELRVSEDGVGATSVALAPHGDGAIAAYVDARRGMSPVHARTLTMAGGKLTLGKDAVVFVGGSAEVFTRVTLGAHGPTAYVLLPVAHDIAFGLGIAKIDGEAPTDAPVSWSDYPNGLDPAPIAATVGDARTTFVARVRPSAPKYGSPRVLEIGEVDAAGAFKAFGVVPTVGSPVDVAIASDNAGGFVLAYTDAAGGWVLRLKCGA